MGKQTTRICDTLKVHMHTMNSKNGQQHFIHGLTPSSLNNRRLGHLVHIQCPGGSHKASFAKPETRGYCLCYHQAGCNHKHIVIHFKTVRKILLQLLNSSGITVLWLHHFHGFKSIIPLFTPDREKVVLGYILAALGFFLEIWEIISRDKSWTPGKKRMFFPIAFHQVVVQTMLLKAEGGSSSSAP